MSASPLDIHRTPLWRYGMLCIVLAGSVLMPAFFDDFFVFQMTLALVAMLAVLGLNLLIGGTGQISLGHGAFYAVGAYASAFLIERWGLPYWATVPMAGLICFVVGFLFGFPALRLAGHYLALATFVLAVCVPQLLKWQKLEWLTGGVQGIVLDKPVSPAFIPLSQDQWLYYLTLGVTVLMFYGAHRLCDGRIGRAMIAVRDHPTAADTMGINTSLVKTTTFGLSAAYAGIAGSMAAILVQFVSPDSFNIFLSISLLVGVMIGGVGTLGGAVFGGLFIQFMPNVADQISKSATWAIYGGLLLVVGFCMQNGIEGLRRQIVQFVFAKVCRRRLGHKPEAVRQVQEPEESAK